jgi:hypothetical protein
MPELAQHVIVTLAALSAAGIIVRRVVGAVAGSNSGSPCDSCPSAALHGKKPQAPGGSATPSTQPLIVVRRGAGAD